MGTAAAAAAIAGALPADPHRCCRFCLRADADDTVVSMQTIAAEQLPFSELPRLFESATAVKLDMAVGYSELLCTDCERQMELCARIRGDLLRIADQWKTILLRQSGDSLTVKLVLSGDEGSKSLDDTLKMEEVDGVSVKLEGTGRMADELHDGVADDEADDDRWQDDVDALGSNDDDDDDQDDEDDENGEANDDEDGENNSSSDEEADSEDEPIVRKEKEHRSKTPFYCDICGAKLTTRHLLLRHMRLAHQSHPSSTCHICGKTNLKRLNQHLRDHRKTDRYQCAHCPKSFCRLAMKEQHERQHTGERPFICEVCAFTFTSPAALKRHARRHTDPQALTLSTNGQVIANPQPRVQAHRPRLVAADVVQKLPPRAGIRLECPLCHHTYVNRSSLQPHMKIQHGHAGLDAWKRLLATTCLVCGDRFDGAARLAEHKLVHQRHQCAICKRRFQSRVTMELHVQKHSKKERRHQCEICEALYPCAFSLRTHHRRAHTAERPYRCGQCPLGFVERWELNSHMKKQHTFLKTLRPHQCKQCAETFRTVDSLRVHMEKHTGRFRYQCQVCKRNQHSGPLLVQHMQSYHMAEWRAEEAEREATASAAAALARLAEQPEAVTPT